MLHPYVSIGLLTIVITVLYQPCNTIVITPPRELDWWRVVIIDRSYYRLGVFADWCSCTALKLGRCYNIMLVSDRNCESAQLMHVGNNRPALKITTPLIRTMAQIFKNTLMAVQHHNLKNTVITLKFYHIAQSHCPIPQK